MIVTIHILQRNLIDNKSKNWETIGCFLNKRQATQTRNNLLKNELGYEFRLLKQSEYKDNLILALNDKTQENDSDSDILLITNLNKNKFSES